HALWTLEGLNRLDAELLLTLLADKDANVRASAAHLCRGVVHRSPEPGYLQELAALSDDPDAIVRLQLALTLGLVNSALADQTLEPVLQDAATEPARLEAILAGFAGREAEFLAVRLSLPAWAKAEPWRQKLLTASAGLMWRQRRPLAVLQLLHL